MGYTHYWYRKQNLDLYKFKRLAEDFKKLLPVFSRLGIKLAGGLGTGEPRINQEEIWFNGDRNCGHVKRDLGIAWPSKNAYGVSQFTQIQKNHLADSDVSGQWFAGLQLNTRTCDGDCSHETFHLPLKYPKKGGWDTPKNGKYFDFCKTAYKPYDLPVICALIIAKHFFGSQIRVNSDGTEENWIDGKLICDRILGYGNDFKLDR